MFSKSHLQELYLACCSSENLWIGSEVDGIDQLDLDMTPANEFQRAISKRIRLGQLAEQFLFNQIESSDKYELVAENIQIKDDIRTLGELDAILKLGKQWIHLEIVYKFYVYDPEQGTSEIERWIGPNRKDSLREKLKKLKDRQFPLLHQDLSKLHLNQLGISTDSIDQSTLFKAQLFVPYQEAIAFEKLNSKCVSGFYIREVQIEHFKAYSFYIPIKHDWLLDPNDTVSWLKYSDFKAYAFTFLSQQQSPLFWLKSPSGKLEKAFLVWW